MYGKAKSLYCIKTGKKNELGFGQHDTNFQIRFHYSELPRSWLKKMSRTGKMKVTLDIDQDKNLVLKMIN